VEEVEALLPLEVPQLQVVLQPQRRRSQPRRKKRRKSQTKTWALVCSTKRVIVEEMFSRDRESGRRWQLRNATDCISVSRRAHNLPGSH
jgi:hypothetical protein